MAILPILLYPNPVLKKESLPVTVIDARLRQLAADMVETMQDAEGVGLAAPQVGSNLRLVVVDMNPGEDSDPRVLINPVISRRCGRKELKNEGCLSFPGLRTRVKRNPGVVCEAQNLDGDIVEYQVDGLAAQAVQHELDHLDGTLFVDKAGPSDKLSLQPELEEMEENYRESGGE